MLHKKCEFFFIHRFMFEGSDCFEWILGAVVDSFVLCQPFWIISDPMHFHVFIESVYVAVSVHLTLHIFNNGILELQSVKLVASTFIFTRLDVFSVHTARSLNLSNENSILCNCRNRKARSLLALNECQMFSAEFSTNWISVNDTKIQKLMKCAWKSSLCLELEMQSQPQNRFAKFRNFSFFFSAELQRKTFFVI